MGLKDLSLPTSNVSLPNGESFDVRGVNLTDITVLIRHHRPALVEFFNSTISGNGEVNLDSPMVLLEGALTALPEVAAELIALAADSPESALIASRLPFPVQFDALEKIAVLTFEAEGGPKKVMETVIRAIQGINSLAQSQA